MPATAIRFHPLFVKSIRRETPAAVSVVFDVGQLGRTFDYKPGQYLTLQATIGKKVLRRSYSISSGPDDGELCITTKMMDGGRFSTWLNTELKQGQTIDVMVPAGRFGPERESHEAPVCVGFAAGSGITPIMSIIRAVLTRHQNSRFFLFYGNKTSADIIFKEALDDLKNRFIGRLSLLHVFSREQQDVDILNGRLDSEKLRVWFRSIVPAAVVDDVYICGPEPMVAALDDACRMLGIAEDHIHIERFGSVPNDESLRRPAPIAGSTPAAILIVDGKRRDIPVVAGETILDAALRHGIDLPYACRAGMCCTCRAKMLDGEVVMDDNYSLESWELAVGFVLTCQARLVTAKVIVDFDSV